MKSLIRKPHTRVNKEFNQCKKSIKTEQYHGGKLLVSTWGCSFGVATAGSVVTTAWVAAGEVAGEVAAVVSAIIGAELRIGTKR